jgi:cation diffusion facilitator family transporter
MTHLRFPILLSIAAAVTTLGLKSLAWWLTGSVGLLSDAAESVINLIAACTAYASLRYSAKPVDRSHTYGHEKIEYFSSGLEGGLIFVAALTIAWTAVERLRTPQPIQTLDLGLTIAVAASAINFAVAQLLLRVGRRHHSIVLEADGQHLMTDVWTSAGVLVGLGLVMLSGWEWLDPVIAILVAVNLLWTGGNLVRRSFDGLMDRALPDEELAQVRRVIESCLQPGMNFHAVRTRRAGASRFADFHLLVPGAMSVAAAHQVMERIEHALQDAMPGLEVTIHAEPIEEQKSYEDSALVGLERTENSRGGS